MSEKARLKQIETEGMEVAVENADLAFELTRENDRIKDRLDMFELILDKMVECVDQGRVMLPSEFDALIPIVNRLRRKG